MSPGETYRNPVYPRSLPDPFVLKVRGEYWAYGTGVFRDGRCFGILHSPDLVTWREVGGALAPLPGGFPCYWAPEVAQYRGRFFLYYSVGNEEEMQIRVAEAAHPAGPFADSGRRLTSEPFAIDAHVFTEGDGTRWLFYATDFLAHTHVGTGTVVDRLLDSWTLACRPRPVTLPRHDWQVYDPRRVEKGGVRWHTVEGPFVLRRKGLHYQMFSGGNWKLPGYGVSYAVSPRVDGPGEWAQAADGERVLPVLRTVPGEVIGPGHNSAVRGPDNRQLYCVYHRWDLAAGERVMAIDPLDWVGERLLVVGPSTTPQPRPNPPTLSDRFDAPWLGSLWQCLTGAWSIRDGEAIQSGPDPAWVATSEIPPSFLAEVTVRRLGAGDGCGIALRGGERELLRCLIEDAILHLRWIGPEGPRDLHLSQAEDPEVDHLVRVEVDGTRATLSLDGLDPFWTGHLAEPATCFALAGEGAAAAFSGFELTVGWEELFLEEDPGRRGWETLAGSWSVERGELLGRSPQGEAVITRGPALASYELVVNGRLLAADPETGPAAHREAAWGLWPARAPDDPGPLLTVEKRGGTWALVVHGQAVFPLPELDPTRYHHLRLRKQAGRLALRWESLDLGEVDVPAGPACLALCARGAAAFDAVRVTALP